MNNLTYREKFTCEMIWGSIPMTKNWEKPDTDYIRGSKIFQDGLKQFDKGEWRSLEKEIWKDVVGFEGLYLVSNLGRVKSLKKYKKDSKILAPQKNKYGYLTVTPRIKGITPKLMTIHRLVAEAFIGERPSQYAINHIDGNKQNNCYNNLAYVTYSENTIHAHRTGLIKFKSGESHHRAKLTNVQVEEIREVYSNKKSMDGTVKRLSERYGVCTASILKIVKGLSYKK